MRWLLALAAGPTLWACSIRSLMMKASKSTALKPRRGLKPADHAASLTGGAPGVLHGNRTYLLQDADGQIKDAYSISAGLDYLGIGPEHAVA